MILLCLYNSISSRVSDIYTNDFFIVMLSGEGKSFGLSFMEYLVFRAVWQLPVLLLPSLSITIQDSNS